MPKILRWLALMTCLVLMLGGVAWAQDGDDDDDDWVEFTGPATLEANTEYEFNFSVFYNAPVPNDEDASVGIQQVDVILPSDAYDLFEAGQPDPPACLHGDCDRWEIIVDTNTKSISWQSFGTVSTVEYGDIREQDVQAFAFVATTDDVPTDGFAWSLWDEDGNLVKEGTFNFLDDDEPPPSDDDTFDDNEDEDDDDEGGCGC